MATIVAGSMLVAWLAGAAFLVRHFHNLSWRIEAAEIDAPEQGFRLHRLIIGAVAVLAGYSIVGLGLVVVLSVAVARLPGDTHWIAVAVAVVGAPVCVLPIVAVVRVLRRSFARVRGATIRAHGRRFVLLLTAVTVALLALAIPLGRALFPDAGAGHIAGMLTVYLLVLVAVQVLMAPLVIVALRAQPLPSDTRRRLRRLAGRMGVRVRDIRVVPGHPAANAAQIGAVPGLRYVVVTAQLLDRLDADEVDAVVAHELGHVRGHHQTMKLAAVFGVWAVLETVGVAVVALAGASPMLLLAPVVVAFPVGLLAVQRLFGARLEQRADDAAARAVGSARLAAALEAISRANGLRPDAGRALAVLTQHPGLDERLRRLRARVPATTERAVVG